jgi:hypothetical protein
MPLKISTELLFTIPLLLTLVAGLYVYSAIIVLSIISALLYHLNKEKRFLYLDVALSTALISTNLYYVYLSNFKFPYFPIALLALAASFYFWMRAQKSNYNFNHSMWHISSVTITVCCVLAYTI